MLAVLSRWLQPSQSHCFSFGVKRKKRVKCAQRDPEVLPCCVASGNSLPLSEPSFLPCRMRTCPTRVRVEIQGDDVHEDTLCAQSLLTYSGLALGQGQLLDSARAAPGPARTPGDQDSPKTGSTLASDQLGTHRGPHKSKSGRGRSWNHAVEGHPLQPQGNSLAASVVPAPSRAGWRCSLDKAAATL